MNSTRKIAIITGVLFIIATAASLVGSSFTTPILNAPDYLSRISANGNQIMLGALFSFIAAATSASIAISLYPILKRYNESLALGAVGFRIIEAVFYIVGIFCLLSLFVLSQESVNTGGQSISYFQTLGSLLLAAQDISGFVLGAVSFSIGALMYYYVFYQSKLIPRWLSGWGLIGAVLMILACVLTVVDGQPFSISGMLMLLAAPIAVQEMVLAVWLIVKGFNPTVIASEPHVGSWTTIGTTVRGKKALVLAIAGAVAFWATNFAISLTPIAAEYRAALSISYLPMIVESLIGGLIIGFFVSYFLLRFFHKIPTKNPILKSVILSFIVLIIVTILIEGPASFLTNTSDALLYFLIGAMFNALRILALGIVIGYLYDRLNGRALHRQ